MPTVFDLVHEDLKQRDEIGTRSYGGPMRAFDGRDSLLDAYQEALDLAIYLRKAMLERDGK